jgi:hypothetical protein
MTLIPPVVAKKEFWTRRKMLMEFCGAQSNLVHEYRIVEQHECRLLQHNIAPSERSHPEAIPWLVLRTYPCPQHCLSLNSL